MTSRWSLQRRLVVALVALLAIVCAVVGTASVLALRESLAQRLDQQVAAELRFVERADGPGGGDPVAAVASRRTTARARAARCGSSSSPTSSSSPSTSTKSGTGRCSHPTSSARSRTSRPGRPQTLHLEGLGDFRVQAENAQGRFYVVGLSLDDLNDTTGSLVLIFALVTAGGARDRGRRRAPLVVRRRAAPARARGGHGDPGLGAPAREGRGRARGAGRRGRTPIRAPRSGRSVRH